MEEAPTALQGVRVLDVSHEALTLVVDLPPPGLQGQEVRRYVVERAEGEFGEDFEQVGLTTADASGYVPRVWSAQGLRPETIYRFRVRSESRLTSGPFSEPVGVRTLPQPGNTWQRVYPRRPCKSRGGHSLVALDGVVFVYGGRSSGVDCDAAVASPSSLGDDPGALPLGRCRARDGVLQELWRYDPVTSLWEELPSLGTHGHLPPAREMHSASVVEGRMVVIGGRAADGSVLGDVWEMDPTQRITVSVQGQLEHGGQIPEGRTTYLTATVDVPEGRCVVSVQVQLSVDHTCTRQLEATLWGPGPGTDDATWRPEGRGQPVRLFAHRDGTMHNCGLGLNATLFDDAAGRGLGEGFPSPFHGSFVPEEALSAFRGVGAKGQWVLALSDDRVDGRNGSVTSWGLRMVTEDCVPTYTWTNRTQGSGPHPGPRYRHAAVVVDKSIYVYGGSSAAPLADLWRLDVETWKWTQLKTGTSAVPPELSGRAFALSPWGLLAFGGKAARSGDAYSDQVWLQNMTTGAWELLPTQGRYRATQAHLYRQAGVFLGPAQPALAEAGPMPRYLSAVALVPQLGRSPLAVEGSLASWPGMGSSSEANVSLLMFGGHDGMQYRDDLFELKLDGLATRLTEVERKRACDWRLLDATGLSTWKGSCHTAMSVSMQTAKCNVSEILLQAWCRQAYQALSSLPV
jgi:subtilisin-like proprotein convertase family protein